jgi:hypothetical protein
MELRLIRIDGPGDLSRRGKLLLRLSCTLLLFLLPLDSFAQAHLWKYRPFRATDADRTGSDLVCDLRRDGDGDGTPDMLGDYVSIRGTVIAEPSTFGGGGRIFWVRGGACGIMVCGRGRSLDTGETVVVEGTVRRTDGGHLFPQSGIASLGDVAIEGERTLLLSSGSDPKPVDVRAAELACNPETHGGNLVRVTGLCPTPIRVSQGPDLFMRLTDGADSVNVYVDGDTSCDLDVCRGSNTITGIVVRIEIPMAFGASPGWCLAPRTQDDIIPGGTAVTFSSWSELKRRFGSPVSQPVP